MRRNTRASRHHGRLNYSRTTTSCGTRTVSRLLHYSNDPDRRSAAKLMTKDEARRILSRNERDRLRWPRRFICAKAQAAWQCSLLSAFVALRTSRAAIVEAESALPPAVS